MSDGLAININQKFEVIYCYKCKMPFAVPANIRSYWIDDGSSFYCPNGHSQCYTESEVQRLQKQLKLEKKQKEWAQRDAEIERGRTTQAKHQVRAQKAAKTKLKKRIAAGVCPCCNRTFQNLARHMGNQHPDYSKGKK